MESGKAIKGQIYLSRHKANHELPIFSAPNILRILLLRVEEELEVFEEEEFIAPGGGLPTDASLSLILSRKP